jgi:hypothetical protein
MRATRPCVMRSSLRCLAAGVALFVACAACSREAPPAAGGPSAAAGANNAAKPAEGASTPVIPTKRSASGAVTGKTLSGVEIECDPALPERKSIAGATVANDGNGIVWTMRGHSIQIRNDVLEIDGARFGAVKAGDKVRVQADGVRVNGEVRGQLP